MKVKSALRESKQSIRVHLAFVAVLGVLASAWTSFLTVVLLGIAVFALAGDVLNILHIARKAKRDPTYLETKVD